MRFSRFDITLACLLGLMAALFYVSLFGVMQVSAQLLGTPHAVRGSASMPGLTTASTGPTERPRASGTPRSHMAALSHSSDVPHATGMADAPSIKNVAEVPDIPDIPHRVVFAEAGERFGVSPLLLQAFSWVESDFNPWAVNHEGTPYYFRNRTEMLDFLNTLDITESFDVGLMQVNSFWLRALGLSVEDVADPEENIFVGAFILSRELQRHGQSWQAIGAYHANPKTRTDRSRAYARKVVARYRALWVHKLARDLRELHRREAALSLPAAGNASLASPASTPSANTPQPAEVPHENTARTRADNAGGPLAARGTALLRVAS